MAAASRTLAAWDALIGQAARADLLRTARAKGRAGREVLLPLGRWPQTRSLAQVLDDAHAGRTSPAVDLDREEREVVAAQESATDAQVLDALAAARADLAELVDSGAIGEVRALLTATPLGPLPVLTLLHAVAYQLAVAALDLEPCGSAADDGLLVAGVVALVDTTGALAARQGVTGSITAVLPTGSWGFGATGGAWRTVEVEALDGPGVTASARVLLDVTSGRALNVPALWQDRSLVTHDLPGLLRLAPVLDQVPGIPGGVALRTAAKAISGVTGLLGRLPAWPF
jgi:hypothetical protein